jgi:hypothetical protein
VGAADLLRPAEGELLTLDITRPMDAVAGKSFIACALPFTPQLLQSGCALVSVSVSEWSCAATAGGIPKHGRASEPPSKHVPRRRAFRLNTFVVPRGQCRGRGPAVGRRASASSGGSGGGSESIGMGRAGQRQRACGLREGGCCDLRGSRRCASPRPPCAPLGAVRDWLMKRLNLATESRGR